MSIRAHDIEIADLTIDLRQQPGDIPVAPTVCTLTISLTSAALVKAVGALLVMTKEKQTIEVTLESAKFTVGGAEIEITAGLNRFLKARATADVLIEAERSPTVAVSIRELRALGKLPIDGIAGPIIEKALTSAAEIPGVTIDHTQKHGVLIEPNSALAHFGVPLSFAPGGRWTVTREPDMLQLSFGSVA